MLVNNFIITKRFSVYSDTQPISKQNNLKYQSIIHDNNLDWKPQIEKLITQFSRSRGSLFILKHYSNITAHRYVYFVLFNSCTTD